MWPQGRVVMPPCLSSRSVIPPLRCPRTEGRCWGGLDGGLEASRRARGLVVPERRTVLRFHSGVEMAWTHHLDCHTSFFFLSILLFFPYLLVSASFLLATSWAGRGTDKELLLSCTAQFVDFSVESTRRFSTCFPTFRWSSIFFLSTIQCFLRSIQK